MLPHVRRRLFRYTLLTESMAHTHGNPLFLEAFVPFVVRNTD